MTDIINLDFKSLELDCQLRGIPNKFAEVNWNNSQTVVDGKVYFLPNKVPYIVWFNDSTKKVNYKNFMDVAKCNCNCLYAGCPDDLDFSYFASSVVVGKDIYYVPFDANFVLKFNTLTEDITIYDLSECGGLNGRKKFSSAAVHNNVIVFTPYNADSIYAIDHNESCEQHYRILLEAEHRHKEKKFSTSAIVGNKLYLTPLSYPSIAICNLSNIKTTPEYFDVDKFVKKGGERQEKFYSVSKVDHNGHTFLVYSPSSANIILVIEPLNSTNSADFVYATKTLDYCRLGIEDKGTIYGKYTASVAVGTKVVFTPFNVGHVLILNVPTGDLLYSDTNLGIENELFCPTTENLKPIQTSNNTTKIVFTPFNTPNVGVVELGTTDTFNLFSTGHTQDSQLYFMQVVIGNTVIFSPYGISDIGKFNANTHEFSTIPTELVPKEHIYPDDTIIKSLFVNAYNVNNTVVFAPDNSDYVGYLTYSIICFLKDTYIDTDQGKIRIDQLEPFANTIEGSAINKITKHVVNKGDTTLIRIEKDALGKNIPDRQTTLTKTTR